MIPRRTCRLDDDDLVNTSCLAVGIEVFGAKTAPEWTELFFKFWGHPVEVRSFDVPEVNVRIDNWSCTNRHFARLTFRLC